MKENLLQYLWQFQHFNQSGLTTSKGESLQVIHPGQFNSNQGPDFLSGKIRINDTFWAGNIEIHVKASDWNLHQHTVDNNYQNIVLHVVWENDVEIKDFLGNAIPTLELQSRVSKLLLGKYETLMNADTFIPCHLQVNTVNPLVILNWKQRVLAERLESRAVFIFRLLEENNAHWEETFWWLIASNFGMKVNSESFERMARKIPVSILGRHKNQIHQVESLLFGVAGLLEMDFTESYPTMLKKEYQFYSRKYGLHPISEALFFLRMRPSNFPTIRLAQLSMLIHKSEHLFSKIISSHSLNEIRGLLDVCGNDYWHYHYTFEETSSYKVKNLGEQMINNILINTIIPVVYSYGKYQHDQTFQERAINWLEAIAPERNVITRGFETLKLPNDTAADSQAYIQLKKEYCDKKRCLQCGIGNALLRSEGNDIVAR